MERFLSVEDLAHITGWRPFTIYKKSAAGRIPGRVKIGHSLRFKESEIEAWLRGETKSKETNSAEALSADAKFTPSWRDRTFQNWTVNLDNLTLYCPRYGYDIDLEKCTDSAQILDWIFHLLNKAWVTEESMIELLLLIKSILDPQGNFCSLGVEQGPLPPSKLKPLLRENINRWILEHGHNSG